MRREAHEWRSSWIDQCPRPASLADLGNGTTERLRIERRSNIGRKDQLVVVGPPLADDEFLGLLARTVAFEHLNDRTGEMEHSPAAHRLELDQLHARLVADELATNMKHDGALSCLDVVPTEPKDLAASESEREGDHVRTLVTVSSHRAQEESLPVQA